MRIHTIVAKEKNTMVKKKENKDTLSMISELLQESIPSMNKNDRNKTVEVIQTVMPSLFDMLAEDERPAKITKAKVIKMKPACKVEAKVRLKKTAKSRKTGMVYLDDVEPRKMLLKITLSRVKPTAWRKVEIPSNISLEHLHHVIQAAFGWYDEHLHKFMVGDDDLKPKGKGYAFDADYDSWMVSLEEVLQEEGGSIKYLYDFGASWVHTITLESVEDYTENEKHLIRMTDGKGACPEEDGVGMQSFNRANIMQRVRSLKQPQQ